MKHLKFLLVPLFVFLIFSCSSDDDSSEKDDIQQLVENFVTPDLISTLEELGFTFRDGVENPNISGTFLYSTHVLESTTLGNDAMPGTQFADNIFTFSNLNPEARTFTFLATDGVGSSFGNVTDTFYSGVGNNFSAYAKLSITSGEATAIFLYAISGTITDEGITNAEDAVVMLDNMGNDVFIANSEGRLLIDQDGLAARQ